MKTLCDEHALQYVNVVFLAKHFKSLHSDNGGMLYYTMHA